MKLAADIRHVNARSRKSFQGQRLKLKVVKRGHLWEHCECGVSFVITGILMKLITAIHYGIEKN